MQEQELANDNKAFKRYDGIMDLGKLSMERAYGVDDVLVKAWVKHTDNNPENHGKGIGKALYNAALNYFCKEILQTNDIESLQGSEDWKIWAKRLAEMYIGFEAEEAELRYGEMKTVHHLDLGETLNKSRQAFAGNTQGLRRWEIEHLDEEDFTSAKEYTVGLAKKLNIDELETDRLKDIREVKRVLQSVIAPRYDTWAEQQKKVKSDLEEALKAA